LAAGSKQAAVVKITEAADFSGFFDSVGRALNNMWLLMQSWQAGLILPGLLPIPCNGPQKLDTYLREK